MVLHRDKVSSVQFHVRHVAKFAGNDAVLLVVFVEDVVDMDALVPLCAYLKPHESFAVEVAGDGVVWKKVRGVVLHSAYDL